MVGINCLDFEYTKVVDIRGYAGEVQRGSVRAAIKRPYSTAVRPFFITYTGSICID
jgi:hypothetical protein